MRSFLGFVVFVGLLVAVLVLVAVPLVARPLVTTLVRESLPFGDQPVQVTVDVGPSLLVGNVDRIAVSGETLTTGGVAIGAMDVDLSGFSILDRSFDSVDGRLSGLELRLDDGTTVPVERVELVGSSEAMIATARLDPAATERLIRAKLAEGGIVPDLVILDEDRIRIAAQGGTVAATIEVVDGGLALVPQQLLPPVQVVERSDGDAWTFTEAHISAEGLGLEATVDGAALLAG